MTITVSKKEKVVIFRLKGKIISSGIKKVRDTVEEILTGHASSPRIVFDFNEVTLIDGSGLGTLVKIYTEILPCGGKIAVINMNKHIRNVFFMSRLDTVIKCYKSEDDAVIALMRQPAFCSC